MQADGASCDTTCYNSGNGTVSDATAGDLPAHIWRRQRMESTRRPLQVEDLFRLKSVSDPQIS
ncbi:MAG: hypothetical protein ACR2PL_27935, partial [Dehalococcoidia bacterium]